MPVCVNPANHVSDSELQKIPCVRAMVPANCSSCTTHLPPSTDAADCGTSLIPACSPGGSTSSKLQTEKASDSSESAERKLEKSNSLDEDVMCDATNDADAENCPKILNKVVLPKKYKQRQNAAIVDGSQSLCSSPQSEENNRPFLQKPDQDWTWNIDFDCGQIVEVEKGDEDKDVETVGSADDVTVQQSKCRLDEMPASSNSRNSEGACRNKTVDAAIACPISRKNATLKDSEKSLPQQATRRLPRSKTLSCAAEAKVDMRRMVLRQKSMSGANNVITRVSHYVLRRDTKQGKSAQEGEESTGKAKVFAAHNSEDKKPTQVHIADTTANRGRKRKVSHISEEEPPAKHPVTRSLLAAKPRTSGRTLSKKPSLLQLGRQKLLKLTTRSKYSLH